MLSEEQIDEIANEILKHQVESYGPSGVYDFARAIEAAVCPPGYVVVPDRPTQQMLDCGLCSITLKGELEPTKVELEVAYEVMIANRPEVTP